MIEMRWVKITETGRQLEYRTKIFSGRRLDATGKTGDVWSNWTVVPTIDAIEAAYEDLRASGGIADAP